jgi:hypothetical protein
MYCMSKIGKKFTVQYSTVPRCACVSVRSVHAVKNGRPCPANEEMYPRLFLIELDFTDKSAGCSSPVSSWYRSAYV